MCHLEVQHENNAPVKCLCGQCDPPYVEGDTQWIKCTGCGVWVHCICYGVESTVATFLCAQCTVDHAPAVEVDWAQSLNLQRQIVKACVDSSYGKGAAGDFRIFQAQLQEKIFQVGQTVGRRFFGSYFLGATLLVHHTTVVAFLKHKVQNSVVDRPAAQRGRKKKGPPQPLADTPDPADPKPDEGKKSWWAKLLMWLHSECARVFLMCEAVLHAAWGKPVFQEIFIGKAFRGYNRSSGPSVPGQTERMGPRSCRGTDL